MRTVKAMVLLLTAASIAAVGFTALPVIPTSALAGNDAGSQQRRFVPDNLFGVSFVSNLEGWASGYYGTLLHTTDGGKSWLRRPLQFNDLVRRIKFITSQSGWLVTHRGRIMHTGDGGKNWEVQQQFKAVNLRSIDMLDSMTGWVVGHEATILHTQNGGKSWEPQSLAFQSKDPPRLNGIAAYDANSAVLVGEFGTIARTRDGGAHWEIIKSPVDVTYTSVAISGDYAIAVGLNGTMVKIPKNGSVQFLRSPAAAHLFDIALTESGHGLAVGAGGAVAIGPDELTAVPYGSGAERGLFWFGGVTVRPDNQAVSVGMNGLIAAYNPANRQFAKMTDWTH